MGWAATTAVMVVLLLDVATAWSPDAGVVQPLAAGVRTVTVSSNDVPDKAHILDSNDNTQWQSGACFPSGFIARPEMNGLLGVCNVAGPRCIATAGSTSLASAFDNSFYTGATVKAVSGRASINVSLAAPSDVFRLYFRGNWGSKGGAATVFVVGADGTSTPVASLTPAANWVDQVVKGPWSQVASVQVVSNDSFTLTELAAQTQRCFEFATLDMQSVQSISLLRVRWWSPDALSTSILSSSDGVTWDVVRNGLVPNVLPVADFYFDAAPLQARYIKVLHTVNEGDWKKIYVWTVDAFGAGGRWGLPPPAVPQTRTLRQVLGVNGIWGWGNGSYSDTLAKIGMGPLYYNSVASSGRNYENMNWDVKKPGNDPKFDSMAKTGTDGQWWLNWDREYAAWRTSGMPVEVSYQFTARDQPPASWPSPYANAYDLGFKFARHFGPTAGTGNVAAFEAGNEPWDYNATFYTTLLRGFIDGAYAGDPALPRLPCALQAHDPLAEGPSSGHYIGARLPQDLAPKISALNLHIYSFFNAPSGQRIAVPPEHSGSSMNGLHAMIRWRDANMPGTPIYVTEWGWDAARPGEQCAMPECVTQLAQAAYGVRGLSLLARKGVHLSHWFFYANDDKCNTLFCRSGLRDTYSAGFAELPVYRAFKALVSLAGSARFAAAPQETADVYAHVLADAAGRATHVLVWRPVEVGDAESAAVLSFDVGLAAAGAAAAWRLTGAAPSGAVAAPLPSIAGTTWTMQVSSVPTLVVLA